jgi:hypothetical protein
VVSLCVLAFVAAPALAAPPEKPETGKAEPITATTAVLHGTLNPGAKSEGGSYQFDYAPAETGGCAGNVAPVSPALALGDLGEKVQETATGLEPNREYLFCVEAFSLLAEPSELSAAVPFETLPAKPSIAAGSENASSVTGTGATLEAQVDGNDESTSYVFEYSAKGKTGAGEKLEAPIVTVAGGSAIEGYGDQTASVATGVLAPGTSYFYRVVASNATGTSDGPVQEFATVPTPTTEPVSPVGASTATFNGKLTPLNAKVPAEYYFEYNLGEELVCMNESATTSESAGAEAVSTAVTGLEPDHAYTVCLVSKNAFGFEGDLVSPPVHFTTKPAPPTIESETSSALSTEGATLEAIVNPNNQETSCEFEYGTEASLTTHTTMACNPAQLGNGGAGVGTSIALAGLKPETVYYYRVVATNAAGETKGTEVEPIKELKTETAQTPAITDEYVTKVQETTATLNAQVNPGGAATTCQFEYGTEADVYPTKVLCAPQPGAGTSPVPVSAPLTGLTPGTTYHYRLLASNAQSPGGTPGLDKTFATPAEPGSTAETCHNAQARTEQPYGQALPDCRAYELVSPLDKDDRNAEAIDSRASVSDEPSGPEASAVTYVSQGSFSGPQGSRKLDRYISKRGSGGWSTQSVTPLSIPLEAQRVAFAELLFTPELSKGLVESEDVPLVEDGELPGFSNLYVADLASNPASYQTVTNVNPPGIKPYQEESGADIVNPKAVGVSTDLSHVVFQQYFDLTPNAEGVSKDHVYEWVGGKLSLVDLPPAGTKFEYSDQAGAPGSLGSPEFGDTWHAVSANGMRVFFTAGESEHGGENEGQLYVRENPEQEPSSFNGKGECTEPAKACTVEVSASQRTDCNVQRKKEEPGYVCNNEPEPDPHNSNPESDGRPYPAWYRDANKEGTQVFFTSRVELTNNANTGPEDNTANLYEYELSSTPGKPGKLTDLTAPTEAEDPKGAAVLGLVTASENVGEENSYVYFVANGVLASNENANKETAQPGDCLATIVKRGEFAGQHLTCSLYVAHQTGGKYEVKFIATLAGADEPKAISGAASAERNDEGDWRGEENGNGNSDLGPGSHSVRVTPDGTTLAFESERPLTGYDNEPVQPGAGATGDKCTERGQELRESDPAVPCREVYLYHVESSSHPPTLVCASCDPSGARPVGRAELGGQEEEVANGFLVPSVHYLPHNLSETGGRLFFQSPDALVPHDSNNQTDVYEWEQPASPAEVANGENSCTSSSPTFSVSGGGCVFPISDVAGDFESRFMDASPSGDNVFVKTKDQLVPEAYADSRANVYDVRVGGGFPVSNSPPPCNNGDACKPPVSPQPSVFGAGATETLSSPGNPPPPSPPPAVVKPRKTVKCKRGFVKNKKGKCIKKKKSKQAKKSVKGRK